MTKIEIELSKIKDKDHEFDLKLKIDSFVSELTKLGFIVQSTTYPKYQDGI